MKLPKELTTITPLSKFLAIVFFITFPLIGFVFGMRYQEMLNLARPQEIESNFSISRVPTSTPIAIPTVDPSITANWKTYITSSYLLKYPQDWITQDTHGEGCGGGPFLYNTNLDINFSVCGPYDDKNYLTGIVKPLEHFGNFSNTTSKEITREQVIIDGHKSILKEIQPPTQELYEIDVYVGDVSFTEFLHTDINPKGEIVQAKGHLTIQLRIQNKQNLSDLRKTFDQILATLKFTDQDNIIPPQVCTQDVKLCSDGKTYVSRQGQNCEFASCPN